MDANERELDIVYDSFPLDLGALKIEKERDLHPGRFQIIDALRHVLFRKLFRALQFDDQPVVNDEIRKIFAHQASLVQDRIGDLTSHRSFPELQLPLHGSFINLFEEPAPQSIRDFVGSPDDVRNQQFKRFAFISVHSRPMMV
jgi:hypothetical protein